MDAAADHRDYELAARFRDRLRAIERISERQTVLRGARSDEDCIAVAVEAGRAMAAVLSIRQGRVMAMETHELEGVAGLDAAACLGAFLPQYYANVTSIPRRLLVSDDIEDREVFEEFLAEQRGRSGRGARSQTWRRPAADRSGCRRPRWLRLRQQRIVDDYGRRQDRGAGSMISQPVMQLPAPPRRIECYDISNTMGTNSVGSMVVSRNGETGARRELPSSSGSRPSRVPTTFASSRGDPAVAASGRLGPRDDGPEADVPVLDPAGPTAPNERPRRTPRGVMELWT